MAISDYLKQLREKVGSELIQVPCVAAIIRADGILLQKRKDDGLWGLPGGAIDPGEAPAQALIREVYEEVGLRVRPVKLLGVFGAFPVFRHVYPNGDQVHVVVSVFECDVTGGELSCRDGEATELRYFPPENAAKLVTRYAPLFALKDTSANAFFEWRDEWAQCG